MNRAPLRFKARTRPSWSVAIRKLVRYTNYSGRVVSFADGPASSDEPASWQLTSVVTRIRRALRSSVRSEIPWERLPMAQVEILQCLVESPEIGVSELAARQKLAVNTVSGLVQQMVGAGLVLRRRDAHDRRALVLVATNAGRAQLHDWLHANSARLSAALAGLDQADRESIHAALPALVHLAERLETPAL